MVTWTGSLKPDDPIRRRGFLIFHQNPYNPGGEKPGTNLPALSKPSRSKVAKKAKCGAKPPDKDLK